MKRFALTTIFSLLAVVGIMSQQTVTLQYYGTPVSVTKYHSQSPSLKQLDENHIREALSAMKNADYNQLLSDCQRQRDKLLLNDWGYMTLVSKVAHTCLSNNNEAVLLSVLLMSGSGYAVRLGKIADELYLLYSTKHSIYGQSFFTIGGLSYFCYPNPSDASNMYLYNAVLPGSKTVSLIVDQMPKLAKNMSINRQLKSARYQDWDFTVSINKNLMDFYNDIPSSMTDNNFMTRWGLLANTPLSEETQQQLYPKMIQLMEGLSQSEKVNRILNWIQTAFPYEFDDKVWGRDRAFFPEEMLYYQYSDTEDRSALFARIVADILGLKTLFLYYPGSTAVGVAFTDEEVPGEYVDYEGIRYSICDGVFIGAPVGNIINDFIGKAPENMIPVRIPDHVFASHTTTSKKPSDNSKQKPINSNLLASSRPETKTATNDTTFAVIIGNENYQLVSAVPFANNDAQSFADCCINVLGMPEKNIRIYQDATYGTMIGAISGLKRIAKAYNGHINVVLYYAGHGIPNEDTGDSFLLPVDGDGLATEVCYPLKRLYQELDGLGARNVTVFLDACFSGSQRGNGMIVAARGVAIKAKADSPQGNTVVFCAASGKQTAYPYEEQKHGMFTYYLLKKLNDTKGNCTLGELGQYVGDMVNRQAVVTNNKEQTPLVLTQPRISESWKSLKLK